ncbi:membrane protein [Burkholderiaceae bacterium 16]|nr:membrane protein [Burkholderiaceae bacterium 16]
MNFYHAVETLLVPLIVLVCALSVLARYAPRTRELVKAWLAASLGGSAATGWRQRAVAWLAPQAAAGCASGCDSGGGNTCDSSTAQGEQPAPGKQAGEQVIRFVAKR